MSKILVLPGDGIGAEIVSEAVKVLDVFCSTNELSIELEYGDIGGAALDKYGTPLPDQTLSLAKEADAILFGAIGGPQYATYERELRPEQGLLRLRAELGVFANLRPAVMYPQLADASSLKHDVVSKLDIMIVRELTGGIYFGEPRGFGCNNAGVREAYNTMRYDELEIRRICEVAFEIAAKRNGRLCSVDKSNVLEVSELWREVSTGLAGQYPSVQLSHMLVDTAAMQRERQAKQFDVIETGNLFGDILSDLAAMLTGSIGMLPSASLDQHGKGLYEPVHGSAPDIAGKGLANPLATILSAAMMLRYSLNSNALADRLEFAVGTVLDKGICTADLYMPGARFVRTSELGDEVAKAL